MDMSEEVTATHVYRREITASERTSLSILAGLIPPGSRVLDLGCGTGALGQWMSQRGGGHFDGVTLNPIEADTARTWYQQVVVSDLESLELGNSFPHGHYDFIVCADVLEHLKQPEKTLRACHELLSANGRLLVSVPNAAYAGLVAELMHGRFDYRDEGLLDRTHLRFFTRATLASFLVKEGWHPELTEHVQRALPESEFRFAFDTLPPSVSRYLLCMEDAQTYQFVWQCKPGPKTFVESMALPATPHETKALFSAELFLGSADGFEEQYKICARGEIGNRSQTLVFEWPAHFPDRPSKLRLDPADRPGFLHLHAIRLYSVRNECMWSWRGGELPDSSLDLGLVSLDQIAWHIPGAALPTPMLLLLGSDPWFEIPIPHPLLQQAPDGCARLEVDVGWPMAADYLVAVHQMAILQKDAHLRAARQTEAETAQGLVIQRLERERLKLQEEINEAKFSLELCLTSHERHIEELTATHNSRTQQLLEQLNHFENDQRQLTLETDGLRSDLQQIRNHLTWLEQSTVFRATRPLVNAKMALQKLFAPTPASPMASSSTDTAQSFKSVQVDVIVPVYKGLFDTQRCIRSALASPCKTPFRLIVINDASPELEVTQWLRDIAPTDSRITLLENVENLGFVATVNRGMTYGTDHDVLLLNSDTEVANDWLDRLQRAAYSHPKVASVTPFSNNATICSYPRFCQANPLVDGHTTASLDTIFSATNPGVAIDVPTGVGFCMYIRRASLNAVGLFDVANFGKGYGEENDFCCRASAAGWRNLHALDTFVLHAGGISFGDSKSARELAAMETLRRLHPGYEADVMRFVQADPARDYRHAVDLARLAQSPLSKVLAVTHDRAGGTLRHVTELADTLKQEGHFLCLTPAPGNRVVLEYIGEFEGFRLEFSNDTGFEALIHTLKSAGVGLVHFHHLLGHHPIVQGIPKALGVPFDFTAHDHYSHCPQISLTDHTNRYCGEKGESQCAECLQRSPAPGGVGIRTWRNNHRVFLGKSRFVLAPSEDAAHRMQKLSPSADVRVAPHTDLPPKTILPAPKPNRREPGQPLKIVVIGALSTIKGADVLESVAVAAKKANCPLEFHLIGYAYRSLKTRPSSYLTVHGEYKESELGDMLDWLQPDLAWFPALWPETYSYTLSACLKAGLPIVAPNLGAFSERLHQRAWSWVQPWDATTEEWLAFFTEISRSHFETGAPPALHVHATQSALTEKSWNYGKSYLPAPATMGPAEVLETPSAAWLHAYQAGLPLGGLQGVSTSARKRLLGAVVRLRSAPGFRDVARTVPLRWQTRVKSWLLR